jgi:hypothetical protein
MLRRAVLVLALGELFLLPANDRIANAAPTIHWRVSGR